ncbi:MAG: LysM peptidoglycan-binding domain-containing protein, partial [Alistipes sp.]|nr:LysM peptidoglycan-binding domain-containing protein [Alistipes sp.]
AHGLKKAGYATAADYGDRLIATIERYNLHLLDKKNGIEAYDEYVARELAMDPAALAPQGDVAQNVETTTETKTAEQGSEAQDMTIAYADRGIDPNNFRVTINSHHGYNVYLTNGAHYVVAKEGDTFQSLGALFTIAPATLRKFNDVKHHGEPKAGDVVYIERKMSRWNGSDMLHTAREGETLHLVAQLYGIRLQPLSKLNRVREDAQLKDGQVIRLR